MSEQEKSSLVWGAKLMTLECGMRFLTDYLEETTISVLVALHRTLIEHARSSPLLKGWRLLSLI